MNDIYSIVTLLSATISGFVGWWTGRRQRRTADNDALLASLTLLQSSYEDTLKQYREVLDANVALLSENSALKKENESLESVVSDLRREIEKLRAEMDSLRHKVKNNERAFRSSQNSK